MQHFSTATGTGDYTDKTPLPKVLPTQKNLAYGYTCVPLTNCTSPHWRNRILHEVVERTRKKRPDLADSQLFVAPMEAITLPLWDLHRSVTGHLDWSVLLFVRSKELKF